MSPIALSELFREYAVSDSNAWAPKPADACTESAITSLVYDVDGDVADRLEEVCDSATASAIRPANINATILSSMSNLDLDPLELNAAFADEYGAQFSSGIDARAPKPADAPLGSDARTGMSVLPVTRNVVIGSSIAPRHVVFGWSIGSYTSFSVTLSAISEGLRESPSESRALGI